MDNAANQQVDPRLREIFLAAATIEYIKGVINENVIHGEEAYKTVNALQWLENLANGLRLQADAYQSQNIAAQQAANPKEGQSNG